MGSVFTDFVRQLELGGREPSSELFDQLWQALRGTLAVEMKRRSNWQTRPSFLGVVGHQQWTEPGTESDGLDELTSDCFEFIFVRRLGSLRRQAERKPNIDGLIHLGVRHFLLDIQSRNDPLGFRVFEILREVVAAAVEDRRLWVIAGSLKIRNETCLAVVAGVAVQRVRGVDLSELICRWAEVQLTELVTATHGRLAALRDQLPGELVAFLNEEERPGFRFGDLVGPLKEQIRFGWAARFLNLPGFMVSQDLAATAAEASQQMETSTQRRHFSELVHCIDQGTRDAASTARARKHLDSLWRYLKGFASDDLWALMGSESSAPLPDDDKIPSHRQLAELLGIPRARMPKLFAQLRQRWSTCQQQLDTGRMTMAPSSRPPRDRAYAALRTALESSEPIAGERVAPETLAVGDLFVAAAAEVDGVEWLVVARDSHKAQCVAVDSCPLTSDGDLDLAEIDPQAPPRVVRFAFEVGVEIADLGAVEPVGHLGEEAMAGVSAKLEQEVGQRQPEGLPAYRDWLDEGPRRAHGALIDLLERRRVERQPLSPPTDLAAERLRRRRPAWVELVAAAALLLVASGLGWRVLELDRLVDRLSAPIVGLPYSEIKITPAVRGPWALSLPAGATHVELGLVLIDQRPFPEYRIDLLRASGELFFRTSPLEPRREYSITLAIHDLAGERLTVRFFGLADGEASLLKEEEIVLPR